MTISTSVRATLLAVAGLWIAVAVGGRQLAFGWLILAPPTPPAFSTFIFWRTVSPGARWR